MNALFQKKKIPKDAIVVVFELPMLAPSKDFVTFDEQWPHISINRWIHNVYQLTVAKPINVLIFDLNSHTRTTFSFKFPFQVESNVRRFFLLRSLACSVLRNVRRLWAFYSETRRSWSEIELNPTLPWGSTHIIIWIFPTILNDWASLHRLRTLTCWW